MPGTNVEKIPFKVYCAKSCNNCLITTTTSSQSCVDKNPRICNSFSPAYCLTNSFIGLEPFSTFCAKLCNSCKPQTTTATTSTTPFTLSSSTSPYVCKDINSKLCAKNKKYCTSDLFHYIGKIPFIQYCAKTCKF